MFRAPPNSFDEIVTKATDENLTSENWELILDVCDKVNSKPEEGPRDAVAAVTKRFAHRNANVQLYSLTLAESLGKNCGTKVHREIASRPFTQALLRLINDRTTHPTVKSRAYELIAQWTEEFKKDPSLSIMDETLRQLKAANPTIQPPSRPQKHEITDADRKKEEEELQMALALSLSDSHITQPSTSQPQSQPPNSHQPHGQQQQQQQYPPQATQPMQKPPQTTAATVSRVKALYDFSPSEPSELPFRRGDIISVLDSVYKDWWRGSLRGQTGIFPVNYVEILKDATPEELIREAEEEAKILSEGRNIEKLLGLLANAEGGRGVEDEELQGLYNSTLAIRPKLVKLIEKYSMRKDELIALNEKFHKARHDYDVLMESSMSRYARPAPAPSTNPFGSAPPGAGPYQQPIQRPVSGYGFNPPAKAQSPPPSAHGYPAGGSTSTTYLPPQWDGYQQQAKPWETLVQPLPQQQGNPWDTQQSHRQSLSWDGQQQPLPLSQDNQQWDNQYQQWDQERPGAPASYAPPTQTQAHHYGGGLDELTSLGPTNDRPQAQPEWYDSQTSLPGTNSQYPPQAPLSTANTGSGGYAPQTSAQHPSQPYFSPPSQPATSTSQVPSQAPPQYQYPPAPETNTYAPPPAPTQPPPAIPFEQKPPYPVGKGQQFYSSPKPPATYAPPPAQGDRYGALRSLSAGSNHDGSAAWYSAPPGKEEDGRNNEGGPVAGGYYAVNT